MTALALDGIGVRIGMSRIVEDVSLRCSPGTVVGLIGPNGSGKSTVLKTVHRALAPSSGRVLLDEVDVLRRMSAAQAARRIAAMTQEAPAEFGFSVLEVVATGLTPHKRSWAPTTAVDHEHLRSALGLVGMASAAERSFQTLSGGEKQRVMLARALAQQPEVLVLDEPTNHLDIGTQLALLDLIRAIGVTTLVALHDLNLAAAYCDRLHLLVDGRLVASGTPEEVLTPEQLADVFGIRADCGVHPVTGRLQLAFSSFPLT